MSTPPAAPPAPEEGAKKSEKKNDEKNLRSFTIRVEEAVLKKLEGVGERTGDDKIARIARNYLRLSDVFRVDNNRLVGNDDKELALVPVELLRKLIHDAAGDNVNAQIDLGNELGKYLWNALYHNLRNTVAEKVDFIRRLGWFSAKRDPVTKHALIPTDFAPEPIIQAMIYQITNRKEMPKPLQKGGKEGEKEFNKRKAEREEIIKNDKMVLTKNVETEIGFDALSYE